MASQGLRLITTNVVRRKIPPMRPGPYPPSAGAARQSRCVGGQGFHASVMCRSPPVISRARERRTRLRERLKPPWPSLNRNSDSRQPSPSSGGTRIDSRNLPETTASTLLVISSISQSTVSSQASQPQSGNGSVRQEPNLKCSPGKSVKATRIGAACGSCGTSLMGGRASLSLSGSSSASCPSNRSTANSRSSRSSNPVAAACRGWNRSGLVTREYVSSGGPSIPHLSPRMSLPPGEGTDAALRDGRHLHRHRRLTV